MINFNLQNIPWQPMLPSILSKWEKEKPTVYILPLCGKLLGVEVAQHKFLSYATVPWDGEMKVESIAEALQGLAQKGMDRKRRILLVSQPSCRIERKRFPDMSEEELRESMYWEEDRLFYTGEPMALGYRILFHTPEGYETMLFAWSRSELDMWTEAARVVDMSWTAAYPVMDIVWQDTPYFILYAGKQKGTLLFHQGQTIQSRRVSIKETNGAFFMQTMMEQQEIQSAHCLLVPMADCEKEKLSEWQGWLEKEIQPLQESGLGIEQSIPFSHEAEEPLWQAWQPLLLRADTCQSAFPLTHELKQPFFCKENRWLRIAQGAALASGLFLFYTTAQTISLTWKQQAVQKETEALAPLRAQWQAMQKERGEEQERLTWLKELESKNPHWEQKLVTLADSMPQGVVLSEIKSNGQKVQITGTSVSAAALQAFEKRLRASWGGQVRLMKRKNATHSGLLEFTVEWKESSQ